MKKKELLQHSECSLCRQKIGHSGIPLFWTIEMKRHGIKLDSVRRSDAFAVFMGNEMIADAMGPDEEMTIDLNANKLTVCEDCAVNKMVLVAELGLLKKEEEGNE